LGMICLFFYFWGFKILFQNFKKKKRRAFDLCQKMKSAMQKN
jgi:hypothetical protein